jgi:transposase-like protein
MTRRTRRSKKTELTPEEKLTMVEAHESGVDVHQLAAEFNISPRSVAAYVANAHRGHRG